MEEAARLNPGKMLSILGLSKAQVEDICSCCGGYVASINCPGQIVVAGTNEAMLEAEYLAKTMGARKVVLLDVSGPFHTPFMESAARKLKMELEKINILPAKFTILVNVTGTPVTSPEQIRDALIRQVSNPVLWENCMNWLVGMGVTTFVEVGPGNVLKGLLKRIDPLLKVMNAGALEDFGWGTISTGRGEVTKVAATNE
jgi:[acyl-carrier-protein] S-malonyltransferase